MNLTSRRARAGLIPFIAMAFLTAACGSSSSGSPAAGAAAGSTTSAALALAATTSAAAGSAAVGSGATAGAAVTVQTKTGALGTYLVDGTGRTLYLWAADKGATSTCEASCIKYWPPLTGTPKAGGSLQQSALSTSARSDGSKQVTYDGHPLYYFAGDKAAGDTAGQGSNGSGALWWVVGTDGKAITAAAGASKATAPVSKY
jgi:predicted lipoprotein with Yx(FWY)xxD motif